MKKLLIILLLAISVMASTKWTKIYQSEDISYFVDSDSFVSDKNLINFNTMMTSGTQYIKFEFQADCQLHTLSIVKEEDEERTTVYKIPRKLNSSGGASKIAYNLACGELAD